MKNKIMTINNINCYEEDGVAYLHLETCARGLGFTQEKNGVEYVRWDRVHGYLEELGFPTSGEIGFIPENIFYRLAMKAKNEAAERFQALVADEIIPALRKTGTYTVGQNNDDKLLRAQAMERNSRSRQASELRKFAELVGIPDTYKQILAAKATEIITGSMLLPLPEIKRRTFTAAEIGEMFSISANKVGRLANENDLKTSEYGIEVWDKSPYSAKEIPSWRYYDSTI